MLKLLCLAFSMPWIEIKSQVFIHRRQAHASGWLEISPTSMEQEFLRSRQRSGVGLNKNNFAWLRSELGTPKPLIQWSFYFKNSASHCFPNQRVYHILVHGSGNSSESQCMFNGFVWCSTTFAQLAHKKQLLQFRSSIQLYEDCNIDGKRWESAVKVAWVVLGKMKLKVEPCPIIQMISASGHDTGTVVIIIHSIVHFDDR